MLTSRVLLDIRAQAEDDSNSPPLLSELMYNAPPDEP